MLGVCASLRGSWLLGRSWLGTWEEGGIAAPTAVLLPSPFLLVLTAVSLAAAGSGMAVATHVACQLFAAQLFSHLAAWSGGLAGAAVGAWVMQRSACARTCIRDDLLPGGGRVDGPDGRLRTLGDGFSMDHGMGKPHHLDLCLQGAAVGGDVVAAGSGGGRRLSRRRARAWSAALVIPCLACGWFCTYASNFNPIVLTLFAAGALLAVGLAQWGVMLDQSTWDVARSGSCVEAWRTLRDPGVRDRGIGRRRCDAWKLPAGAIGEVPVFGGDVRRVPAGNAG